MSALLRFFGVCFVALVTSVLAFWIGGHFLSWVSIARHGSYPGGGWSIAMVSVFTAGGLAIWLLLATVLVQLRQRVGGPDWPISRVHGLGLAAWAILQLSFASLLVVL